MKSEKYIYDILAIVIVAFWGLTFISTSKLLEYFQPSQIFAVRFSIAYAGMWIFSHDRILSDSLKDELMLVLGGMMGGSVYFLTENTALKVSDQASVISFIVCTTPLVTALLAIVLHRKGAKMTPPLAVGSIVALAGVAMMMFNGSANFGAPLKGYLLAMGASLTWAFYTLIVGELGDKYPSAFITRKVFFYGLVTIIPYMVWENAPMDWAAFRLFSVGFNVFFLAIVASLACYALWTPVIRKLGTIRASNYIYLNPVFTLLGSLVFLNEPMNRLSLLGSLVTLLGVWIASRRQLGLR